MRQWFQVKFLIMLYLVFHRNEMVLNRNLNHEASGVFVYYSVLDGEMQNTFLFFPTLRLNNHLLILTSHKMTKWIQKVLLP